MPISKGAVAGGHHLTVEAAEQVLRAGGNAFDAALAGWAASVVTEPLHSSLGGGGFLLAMPEGEKPRIFDAFAHTPHQRLADSDLDFTSVQADLGDGTQDFYIGLGSVAVPGVVRGMFAVQADLGTLPMQDLVSNAVEWAKHGVQVSDYQAQLFGFADASFGADDIRRKIYASQTRDGELAGQGEILRQPELADVLEVLAHEGPELFYRGEIAALIENDMLSGGQLNRVDFGRYQVERREPLLVTHRGARVYLNPPPASGGLLIAFGLRLLETIKLEDFEGRGARMVSLLASVLEQTIESDVAVRARDVASEPNQSLLLDESFLCRYRDRVLSRAANRPWHDPPQCYRCTR